jgi:two-component sensor histidine kinase
LTAEEGGGFRLIVGDDGVGFPAGLDFRTAGTLGLRLVNMLVSQLHGRIEKLPVPGTVFSIVIMGQAWMNRSDSPASESPQHLS